MKVVDPGARRRLGGARPHRYEVTGIVCPQDAELEGVPTACLTRQRTIVPAAGTVAWAPLSPSLMFASVHSGVHMTSCSKDAVNGLPTVTVRAPTGSG